MQPAVISIKGRTIPVEVNAMTRKGASARKNEFFERIRLLIDRAEKISGCGGPASGELALHIETLKTLRHRVVPHCETQADFQVLEARLGGISRRIDNAEAVARGEILLEPTMR